MNRADWRGGERQRRRRVSVRSADSADEAESNRSVEGRIVVFMDSPHQLVRQPDERLARAHEGVDWVSGRLGGWLLGELH